MQERLRQPVVVVLGHVDSGKTSLLDKVRGTAVQAREAGGMTQHIGASFFPLETIRSVCGPLLTPVGGEVRIPGLLVIDTPGHEVFSNLRTRGGSAADISVLVVDAVKGFEVQTYESVEILRRRRVPFIVALNKVDLIPGWRKGSTPFVTESLKAQAKPVADALDEQVYSVIGVLSRLGFRSEAFQRVKDFTKEVAIVPVSAKTGEGIPELLAVLVGLTQQYLRRQLAVSSGAARGIALEVKEEPGLGPTVNVILLDGVLKTGDSIVLARRDGAFATRIKAIFMPKPLDEMRDPRDRFTPYGEVRAAAGVKIAAPGLEEALAGSPLIGLSDGESFDDVKRQVEGEVKSVVISTDDIGVIIKSDTLGSLEAIVEMLKSRGVKVRIADIGPVSRREVVEASTVAEKDYYSGVIIGFNVKVLPDAAEEAAARGVKVLIEPVLYNLVQGYLNWVETEREVKALKEFALLTPPCKFRILRDMVFRRSDPAIFGVEVLSGRLTQKAFVINVEGKTIGTVHQIQDRGKSLTEAPTGSQVAVSIYETVLGRHIHEGETLYAAPKGEEVKLLTEKYLERLGEDERRTLEEIIDMKRKVDPMYGF